MNAARLLREVTRSPLWRYEDDRLVLIVPSGAHAMHRHVTKDACNMQWTDSLRFSRAMPAIVPSPDGIYIAPFIEVALRHTMREYDPRITVAKIDEDVFRKTELAAYSSSTRYDRVNRDYGNEVILPDAARAYRVYNVAGSKKPPSCMTKPMKIHTKVERNVEYESRLLFTDPPPRRLSQVRADFHREDERRRRRRRRFAASGARRFETQSRRFERFADYT